MGVVDDPCHMLRLLGSRFASSRTVSRTAVYIQLFRILCKGQDMASYIHQYTSLLSQLERAEKDSAILVTTKVQCLLPLLTKRVSYSLLPWHYAKMTFLSWLGTMSPPRSLTNKAQSLYSVVYQSLKTNAKGPAEESRGHIQQKVLILMTL